MQMGIALIGLSSCASSSPVGPVQGMDDNHGFTSSFFRRLVDHEKDDWNPLGIWRRVSGQPPTYVPVDMPKSVAMAEAHGTWFIDASDGYRFFVPKNGTPEYNEEVLKGEAAKITNRRTRGENLARNARRGIGYLILSPMEALSTSNP